MAWLNTGMASHATDRIADHIGAGGASAAPPAPGRDYAALERQCGIPAEHLAVMAGYARDNKVIFGIRPISTLATSLIRKGYPTKGLHIKGKSADWGPQAAFICCDQALSKVAGKPEAVAKYNQKIAECVQGGHGTPGPLVLGRQRLAELRAEGGLEQSLEIDGKITLFAQGPDGKQYQFTGICRPDGQVGIQADGRDVMVLCHPKTKEPFVPDYDLLLGSPHISDFDTRDTIAPFKRNDPDLGTMDDRLRGMMADIHALLGRDADHGVIQHGADTENPETDEAANFPAAVFSPHAMGAFAEVSVVRSSGELKSFIHAAKDHGYPVPVNQQWQDLQGIVGQSFTRARQTVAASLGAAVVTFGKPR